MCENLPEKEGKRKKLSGKIVDANDTEVVIGMEVKKQEDSLEVRIPYEHIHKAKVIFEYDKLYKQPKKKR